VGRFAVAIIDISFLLKLSTFLVELIHISSEYVGNVGILNIAFCWSWCKDRSQKQHSAEVRPRSTALHHPRSGFSVHFGLFAESVSQVFPFDLDCLLCTWKERKIFYKSFSCLLVFVYRNPVQATSLFIQDFKSAVVVIVVLVCKAIWKKLQKQHMPEPTVAHFEKIAEDFWDTWQFPNCIGCIDGKHVRIKRP
jgi:hypothetical protein